MEQEYRVNLADVLKMLRNDMADLDGIIECKHWGDLETLAHDIMLCGDDLERYAKQQQAYELLDASK